MNCIYCGAAIKENELRCPVCSREVQLVPDYNIMDDEYLKQLMEEEATRKNREKKAQTETLWEQTPDPVRERSPEPEPPARSKQTRKKKNSQKKKLIAITVIVLLVVIGLIAAVVCYTIHTNHANSYDYQISQAEAAVSAGDTESAISCYERALKLDKNSVEVRILLGNLYMKIEDWDSALLMFEEAVNLDNSSIDAYTGLLTVYEELGEYDKISDIRDEIDDITILNALSDFLVDAPVFSMDGGTYDTAIEVALTSADDCAIYYTTDGTDPVVYGSKYTTAFSFDTDGSYIIYAVCINANGVCSETISNKYTIDLAAPSTPIVSPEGGNYVTETEITIAVPDGCTAYYTWDGTEPNVSSTKYTGAFTIPVGSNVLSVIIVDDTTEKISPVYRANYTYYEQ